MLAMYLLFFPLSVERSKFLSLFFFSFFLFFFAWETEEEWRERTKVSKEERDFQTDGRSVNFRQGKKSAKGEEIEFYVFFKAQDFPLPWN